MIKTSRYRLPTYPPVHFTITGHGTLQDTICFYRGKETLPTAQILYVAEEADDIDEEDPDDDLDI